MPIRKLIKLNSTGSIAVVLPKQICAAKGLKPGDCVEVSLGKKGEIIIDKDKV